MNIKYICNDYLNDLTITIEPATNDKSAQKIVELEETAIVLEELSFLSWSHNKPIGLSRPQRASISILFDVINIETAHKAHLYEAILKPYQVEELVL